MKKIISLCLALSLPGSVVLAASPVILENPPALFFAAPNKLNAEQIEKIVLEGLNRSNSPDQVWSVEAKQAGMVNAKLVVRNKHTAFVDIKYDPVKILISYRNSDKLDYEKIQGKFAVIHPNYLKWVDFLASNIKSAAQFAGNDSALSETPPASNMAASQTIVIAAYAAPGDPDEANPLTRTVNSYSKTFLNLLAKKVNHSKPDTVKTILLDDANLTKSLIDESRDTPVSQQLCKQYNASKLFIGSSPTNPGGRGTRYVTYYLYICDKGRKFTEKYLIERGLYDAYGYQGEYHATIDDFMNYSKIYR